MSESPILFEKREDGIAVVTLNRPEKLNALTGPLLDALDEAVDRVANDPEIRVFLIRGAPRPDHTPVLFRGSLKMLKIVPFIIEFTG